MKVSTPSQFNADIQPIAAAGSIQEHIMQLFQPASSAEHFLQRQVDSVIREFLNRPETNSKRSLQALMETLTNNTIPSEPMQLELFWHDLTEQVITHSNHTASPRFIGHMTPALPYFVRPLAKLIAALNQNVVKVETAKAFTPYERQALACIHRLVYNCSDEFYSQHIQNPESTLGMIGSGGTIANITALWCARNAALKAQGDFAGVEKEGLAAGLKFYGYEGAVVMGSRLMHYSFEKAADLLGIGSQSLIQIATNDQRQIDLNALQAAIEQCRVRQQLIIAIVGIAGTTDAGGVDPLFDLAQLTRAHNIHFHVDAAWGGAVLFSKKYRHLLAGIEQADSVTIDAHKQFYLPIGMGMLLFRNPHQAQAIEKNAPYTVRKYSYDLGRRSLEGSRSGAALLLQAGLHLIGMKGYEYLIDQGMQKARYMAQQITIRPEFELLANPTLNILLYRYIPESLRGKFNAGILSEEDAQWINRLNKRLQKTQRQSGHSFVSRTTLLTTIDGQTTSVVALRAVISNPLTTEQDIDSILEEQIRIGRETDYDR